MSSSLYALGRLAATRWRVVLLAWALVLAGVGGSAAALDQGFVNSFSIPGTESQEALDTLSQTFPEVSGATGQLIVVAQGDGTVDDPAVEQVVEDLLPRLEDLDQAAAVVSPFAEVGGGEISDDRRAAIVQVQMDVGADDITDETRDALVDIAEDASGDVAEVVAGGGVFTGGTPALGITEVVGVAVALVVLFLTLGSLVAAGLPILTALVGVGVAMLVLVAATSFFELSSTTPLLGLMIGLAVGIDYALYVLARHRELLADGVEPPEAAGRAVATAGSAVVFAGLTVMIALAGLSVVGIPFLTTMGLGAALAVAVAVCVATTLLPALAGALGHRLRPKERRARRGGGVRTPNRVALGWVGLVTRRPLVTTLLVVLGLGAAAVPALSLRLALPDNGTALAGTPARVAFDTISENFGPGYNGPLVVTGGIVTSDDPLTLVEDVADEIRALPDVADVPLAVPNPTADTMIIQVVPEGGPTAESTERLVDEIRGLEDRISDTYGVDIAVTGQTAVGIDVSSQLSASLLPFALLVVGLSLVLLTMVFRSVTVPLKATAGYLLSVFATFGIVVAIFQWGWASSAFGLDTNGPILSFLPIILMGLLFGLAMDYEVFLVSRMREAYAHGASASEAIRVGYASSSRVVVAAAVIMVSVFAAFVPHGDATLKPIAFALAAGVFIDAFVVRLTLVPAVMELLGDRAWWLPRAVGRVLPGVDVEGEGLARRLALQDWPRPGARGLHAEGLGLVGRRDGAVPLLEDVAVDVEPGQLLLVTSEVPLHRSALALVLSGRTAPTAGRLVADGLVLPEQGRSARRRVALVRVGDGGDPVADVRAAVADGRTSVVVDGVDLLPARERAALVRAVVTACHEDGVAAVVTTGPEDLREEEATARAAGGAPDGGAVAVATLVLPTPAAPEPPRPAPVSTSVDSLLEGAR